MVYDRRAGKGKGAPARLQNRGRFGGRAAQGQHKAFSPGWPGPITAEKRSPTLPKYTTAKVGKEGTDKI